MGSRRVLLAGNDPLALGGIARLIDAGSGVWRGVLSLDEEPEAVLLDLGSSDASSEPSEPLEDDELYRGYPVLVLTDDPRRAREALAAGARGALSRGSNGPRLESALAAVSEGLIVLDQDLAEEALRPPPRALDDVEELTPRELEVLEQLALGLSNREIAAKLGVSFHTVKFHVNSILGKLGAASRTEVVALAARAGLLRF